ncbi:MAG: EamA family transporter [Thaumarchaeota archaeon]|nr:EamA family transporter [Nitrososphaerota archaeon]
MFDPAYAMIASVIWAFSPIYYGTLMKKLDFLVLNWFRTSMAAAALAVPAAYFGFTWGVSYALLSGVTTLALGDSLFLLAIKDVGASVSAPVVYTYIVFIQLTAGAVGDVVPAANYLSAVMVVFGVFVLSRGGEGRPRAKGVAYALAAALVWTGGQDLISVATGTGANVVTIAFARNFAAALALGVAVFALRRGSWRPVGTSRRELGFFVFIGLSDLVVGSLLYVYSVSLVRIALTVILTSLSPLLTQVFSKALGKESPSIRDLAGGILIVTAVIIAVVG